MASVDLDLPWPLVVVLNLVTVTVLAGCLLVIWRARRSVGLLAFAGLFSLVIGGVMIPIFAIAAAITVTVSDRRSDRPERVHSRPLAAVLRHFRGRPTPAPEATTVETHVPA